MEIRIIKSPSAGTMDILLRRITVDAGMRNERVGAVGLIQGKMIEMICAADIAEKAVGVTVADVKGSCPQNMILLAVFGDMAAVEAALQEIKHKSEEGNIV